MKKTVTVFAATGVAGSAASSASSFGTIGCGSHAHWRVFATAYSSSAENMKISA